MSTNTSFGDAAAMWNQRYAGDELLFGEAPNDYLRAQAPRLPRAVGQHPRTKVQSRSVMLVWKAWAAGWKNMQRRG